MKSLLHSFLCQPLSLRPILLGLGLFVAGSAGGAETILFTLTNTWRYNQTVSYDGTNWTTPSFNDSALPAGRGVLAIEDNAFVTARTNTVLTLGRLTYYFRTTFVYTGSLNGTVLTFSNIVDDGAVFYLNGVEVKRLFMTNDTTPVVYATLASSHEAGAFDVFTLSGPLVENNLVRGTNVLAVEVHQTTAGSSDIVFGCALSAKTVELTPAPLHFPLTPPTFGYSVVNAFTGLNFGQPVSFATPPGEMNRLFVVNQAGTILVITNLASPNLTTFMDLSAQVFNSGESGLLGLAFHPGYATNRYFFVFYSATSPLRQRLSRFQTDAANPNSASTNSELLLISQVDPASNHNGADVHFGPDGLLYVSLGDGGVQNDGSRNSQIITSNFFSAIMRLDVDEPFRASSIMPNPHAANTNTGPINYRIPIDNPFIGFTNFDGRTINSNQVHTEFYAVGFRNPWRFSFDPATGWLYCGDVGQDTWEEVNVITKGGNYGWAYREATHPGPRATNTVVGPLIDPIQEYVHISQPGDANYKGNAVIGGVVYRGARFPQLYGWYVFGDNSSANIWMLRYDGTNTVPFQRIASRSGVSAFGTDPSNGDVLMADVSGGGIYRLIYDTNSASGASIPPTLAETGAFTNLTTLTNQTQALGASAGMLPYDINVHFWSDNALKSRWFLTATNLKMGFSSGRNWTFPSGAAWVKHFDLELTNGVPSSARRLETRFLIKNTNGIYGVTYRWASLTNAVLVPESGFDEPISIDDGGGITRTQVWHYPSRTECTICHSPVGGFALGFTTEQLNRDYGYVGGVSNQLAFFSAAGMFSNSVGSLNVHRALAPASDESSSLEWRVRSYLAANCAQCHQPGGAALGSWVANINYVTGAAGLINGPLNNNFGNTNARVIAPGSLGNSMIHSRLSVRGATQMPPLASSVLDTQAISLLSRWITNDLAGGWSNTTAPLILSIGATNGGVVLQYTQPANRAVVIMTASNLNPPVSWQFLDLPETRPSYPAAPVPVSFPDATNAIQKFYLPVIGTP